ncbi:MAG: hypothetical protein PVF73_06705 [Bacteroidales bacterium]|jgi:hypothetical protein
MKKLSFLFVAFALVGFISFNACKSSTQPAEEATEEEVVEEVEMVEEEPVADTVDMEMEAEEEVVEE